MSGIVERFVSRLKYPQNRFGSEKHESEISWREVVRLDLINCGSISLFTIGSCYGKITYGIYISKTILNQVCSAAVAQDIKEKKSIVKMLMANTLLFAASRLPTLAYFLKVLYLQATEYSCLIYVGVFGYLSAFCHPLIIIFFIENYRTHVKRMFTRIH